MTAQNIGKNQRIIRIIVGIIFIILGWAILKNNWLGVILNLLAAYLLLTSVTGSCWIYGKMKKSTLKNNSAQPPANQTPPPQSNPNEPTN